MLLIACLYYKNVFGVWDFRAECSGQSHSAIWPKPAVDPAQMRRGLLIVSKKFQGPRTGGFPWTPFQRCFANGEIHSLAVYIHEQINGTFEDIFPQLYERVDTLEYPNSGSSTLVTMGDAKIIVEDIGAHADDLPAFLADDGTRDKFIGFPITEESIGDGCPRPRHPRYAKHGFKKNAKAPLPVARDGWEEDLSTEELMARSKKEADGIWFKPSFTMGFVVYSRSGTYDMSRYVRKQFPTDPHFNVWYKTHMSPGWMPCQGPCAGTSPPRWWNVHDEEAPFVSKECARKKCIGYCPMARRAQMKG
jgi:hypothetical protein